MLLDPDQHSQNGSRSRTAKSMRHYGSVSTTLLFSDGANELGFEQCMHRVSQMLISTVQRDGSGWKSYQRKGLPLTCEARRFIAIFLSPSKDSAPDRCTCWQLGLQWEVAPWYALRCWNMCCRVLCAFLWLYTSVLTTAFQTEKYCTRWRGIFLGIK